MKRSIILGLSVALLLMIAIAYFLFSSKTKVIEASTQTSTDNSLQVKPVGHLGEISILQPLTGSARAFNFDEQDFISSTNDYRTEHDLSPLSKNDKLTESACAKAQHMVDNNYWSHDAPDGTEPWHFFNESGYLFNIAGENLAYGFKDSNRVVEGWINSPTHEANLRGDYTEMGVCTKTSENYMSNGFQTVVVAHYASPR